MMSEFSSSSLHCSNFTSTPEEDRERDEPVPIKVVESSDIVVMISRVFELLYVIAIT